MWPKGRGARRPQAGGARAPRDSAEHSEAAGPGRGLPPALPHTGKPSCHISDESFITAHRASLLRRRCLQPLSPRSTPSCPDRRKWWRGAG